MGLNQFGEAADSLIDVLLTMESSQFSGKWETAKMQAYAKVAREAEDPHLGETRMRELVERAMSFDDGLDNLADFVLEATLAIKVLSRPDCPHDLLMFVAVNCPYTKPEGTGLVKAVLSRPDCPEDVRVAAALAEKQSE